jgi:hypothetical protein
MEGTWQWKQWLDLLGYAIAVAGSYFNPRYSQIDECEDEFIYSRSALLFSELMLRQIVKDE